MIDVPGIGRGIGIKMTEEAGRLGRIRFGTTIGGETMVGGRKMTDGESQRGMTEERGAFGAIPIDALRGLHLHLDQAREYLHPGGRIDHHLLVGQI